MNRQLAIGPAVVALGVIGGGGFLFWHSQAWPERSQALKAELAQEL